MYGAAGKDFLALFWLNCLSLKHISTEKDSQFCVLLLGHEGIYDCEITSANAQRILWNLNSSDFEPL